VKLAALVLAALALTGCESNQQRSAKLAKAAKQREHETELHAQAAQKALAITHVSTRVEVIAATVLHDSEGAAAVLTLRNSSNSALRDVPIQITVKNAAGASTYTNATPGLSPSLVSVSLLPAHGVLTWIDDQVQSSGAAASVSTKVGEASPASGAIPTLTVQGAHLAQGSASGAGAEGVVVNRSGVSQQELIVYAVARRAGRIVAAGRAVLAQAPAGASTPFQIFLVGEPRGATLEVSAPATTLG
jgi:hypothetical protein